LTTTRVFFEEDGKWEEVEEKEENEEEKDG